MQKFHSREYQRCVADVFKVVGHEFARRVNVMLGVAGRVRDFPDLAVAVVGPVLCQKSLPSRNSREREYENRSARPEQG
jgi:hypothetical protein